MQKKIKNREALLSHGDINGRKIVLDITEKTLQHLDAYERIKSIAHMEGDTLCIGSAQARPAIIWPWLLTRSSATILRAALP